MVVDTNFIQCVNVDFCGCVGRQSQRQQLLAVEWFPATVRQPKTCFTFQVLELFHALTLTGKMSAYEFYRCLEHLTDNTELNIPKVRLYLMSYMRYNGILASLQIIPVCHSPIQTPYDDEASGARPRCEWLGYYSTGRAGNQVLGLSIAWHQHTG